MSNYALITGSSKGIGMAMAKSLAKRKFNLLLVARSGDHLLALKKELSETYRIQVEIFPTDLSVPGAAQKVAEWCQENSFPVSVLINNAGYGVWGDFENIVLDEQLNMLRLNINAVVELTHYLLPILKEQSQSYILNVASTAAYQALPMFSLYAASKAFILSFSRGLRFELRKQNISVTCLSPGPVDTGFADRAGLAMLNEMAAKFNMMPDVVAEIAIKGMLNKRSEIIPGFINQVSAFAARILPKSVLEYAGANIYKI
ncbi:MAG: SDR family NAD(P)-dependent oxidoreductase [Daejeonella sp.]